MRKSVEGVIVLVLTALPLAVHSQSLFDTMTPGARAAGLGNAIVASVHDPLATFWNPAALGFIQDAEFRLASNRSFYFNYAGASQFFPRLGGVAVALAQFPLANSNLDRAALGFGHRLSKLGVGGTLNFNRQVGDDYTTLNLAAIIFPFSPTHDAAAFRNDVLPFNTMGNLQKIGLAVTVHDLALGRKRLSSFVDLGMYWRTFTDGPTLHGSVSTNGHNELVRFGVGLPVTRRINFVSGIEDFDPRKSGIGVSLSAASHSFDVVYSFANESVLVDFSVRFGNSPWKRAEVHRKKSVQLARKGEYRDALDEAKDYLAYDPTDTSMSYLKAWLAKKLDAQKEKIAQLLQDAKAKEQKHWYISATLDYLQVLELQENHREAKKRLLMIEPMVDIYINQLFDGGVQAYEQGQFEQAGQAFKTVLKVRKNHEEARQYLDRLTDYYAKQSEELFLRGLGFYSQKNFEKAIESFREALGYNQDNDDARNYLDRAVAERRERDSQCETLMAQAKNLVDRKDYIGAFNLYADVLEINPFHNDAKTGMQRLRPLINRYLDNMVADGRSALNSGKLDQAEKTFRVVLNYDPGRKDAQGYLSKIQQEGQQRIDEKFQEGMSYYRQKDWSNAIAAFDEVLTMDNNNKVARQMRRDAYSQSSNDLLRKQADRLYEQRKFLEAMDLYSQLLERKSNNPEIQQRLEECQHQLNLEVDRLFNRGISYYTAENYRAAITEWDMALKINPKHAQSLEYKKKAQQLLNALERLQ